ncbi:MAG: translation initiation factor eIF-1A [Candidatus Aenigmatarchaeota archaeon]
MINEEEIRKIRIPKKGEILGIAEIMLGAGKVRVRCEDDKERLCRIRGKLRKRIWIRVGDMVLIKPWDIQPDEKADIIWRYTKTQANWLRKKGYGKNLE